VDPIAAELALTEAAAARRRGLALARSSMAVPLRLLSTAWIVLCPTALIVGRDHLGPCVGVALLVITVVAWTRYRLVARRQGARARFWPWLLVAVAAVVGGAGASRAGADHGMPWLNVAGPFVVNALALLALARLLRSWDLGICAAIMVAISIGSALAVAGDAAVATQLAAYAVVLLLTSTKLKQ
jgi:hypothetical protein